jgi:hypothetical protein
MVDLICRGVLVGLPPTNQHFENVQILSMLAFIYNIKMWPHPTRQFW